jgi:hypothetical protein
MLPPSLQERQPGSRKSPTGRLGIFHGEPSNIPKGEDLKNPQPSRLGDCRNAAAPFPVGRGESPPTFRLGDSWAFSQTLSRS